MKTEEVKVNLKTAHENLWSACESIPFALQTKNPDGKWSAVQHVQHIGKGIAAVCKYLQLEKSIIEIQFGLAGHASRSHAELMQFMQQHVKGAVSTERFVPDESANISFESEKEKGLQAIESMINSLDNWTEKELDRYLCPHPLLGKLTAREMLYFTIFHAQHHTNAVSNIKIAVNS